LWRALISKTAHPSRHTIVAALRFLYRVTLRKDWTFEDVLPLPKKQQKLPVVLSLEEVQRFLDCVHGIKHRAILFAYCGVLPSRSTTAIILPSAENWISKVDHSVPTGWSFM
jgi:integrase